MSNKTDLKRRRFLKHLAYAAGGTSLLSYHGKMQLIQSAFAAPQDYAGLTDYKTLVCIFLFGGNDSFNMFLPHSDGERSNYVNARAGLAIPVNADLDATEVDAIDPSTNTSIGSYAFHPSMPEIAKMYRSGKLAVVANTGNLIVPVDREQYINRKTNGILLPEGLFSHNNMQDYWQTSQEWNPGQKRTGWGGRMADMMIQSNSKSKVQALYSMAGIQPWGVGDEVAQLSVGTGGLKNFAYLKDANKLDTAWSQILEESHASANPFEKTNALITDATRNSVTVINKALQLANDTVFDNWDTAGNTLAARLKIAAKLIDVRGSATDHLDQKRQIIFVGIGGWDTHGNQLVTHAGGLGQLDEAMAGFQTAIDALGLSDSVTAFTASEFGRSLTINGDGTDHAWGAHTMVMGGAVNGGKVYGSLPSLELGGVDDAYSDGRIIPTTSIDEYGAALGSWFGISEADLNEIFPNLSNFTPGNLPLLFS